ncbi:MAG: hypothetical protein ACJAUP_000401 [Cellvibrionaceae bacterium]|jgi:uncharacterized protein YigA (DUF484 family)
MSFINPKDIPVLTALTDEQVADFLLRNPDFLVDKPAVLAELNLPHQLGGKAVSLVERQVSVLRERNMDMRHRLNTLLDNARVNDLLFDKTKRLVLSLLDTDQFDDCLDALFFGLQNEFEISFSSLLLINSEQQQFVSPANQQAKVLCITEAEENLGAIIHNPRAICGQIDEKEKNFIFARNGGSIGSTAIAPLKIDSHFLGLLAVGNPDPDYYRSSMNTLFLNFIADTLSRLLGSYSGDSSNLEG